MLWAHGSDDEQGRGAVTLAVAILATAGCSFPSRNNAPVVRFHGEADDPVGDTASAADARIPRPADLMFAAIEVTDDAVRLTVRTAVTSA